MHSKIVTITHFRAHLREMLDLLKEQKIEDVILTRGNELFRLTLYQSSGTTFTPPVMTPKKYNSTDLPPGEYARPAKRITTPKLAPQITDTPGELTYEALD